jgi:protein-S-isoprenylcysteine O-methyltransferase Ste14
MKMRTLERKIPPVALVLLFAVLIWLVSRSEPSLAFSVPWRAAIALIFCCTGIAITLAGLLEFRRAKTTVNPIMPETTTALVTSGIYRFSRNPMYLGFLLALIGWAVLRSHLLAFALLPLFVLYMNRFQIMPEERALSEKFGGQFKQYTREVRRWL